VGQKIHPKGLRLGIVKDWDAHWYARKKEFSGLLLEDVKLRKLLKRKFYTAGVARIELERAANRIKVTLHTAKPGLIIGRGGAGIEATRKELEALTKKHVTVNIVEIRQPELDAQLVAESIAQQLERRIGHRRAMKQSIQRAMRMGAKGMRVVCAGRLNGAEIARRERSWEGTVPLHTLRADIDYGTWEANTSAGKVGVKVWLFRGDDAPRARRAAGEGGR
jgi:small subunit ribosomal protein S3